MKNKSIIMAAAAALILSACGKTESTPENTAANEQQTEVYVMQTGDTEISGEVVSVIGNEVTLELGEVSESQKPTDPPDENGGDPPEINSSDNGERPDFEQGGMPDGGFGNGNGPEPSDGEIPDFGSFDNGGNGGRQGSSNVEITKSGETEAYIIPVGMTVSGLSGRSTDYSGITEGDILTLVVDSEGTVRSAEVR